jgi:hypothetical protein
MSGAREEAAMQGFPTLDPLRVLTADERREHLDAYLHFLRARDGEDDLESRTLSRREQRMRAIEASPVVWRGEIDEPGFRRCLAGERGTQLDARTEWVLAAAKANEGERYGVEIEIRRYLARGGFPGVRDPVLMRYVLMQESYHCRILVELCRTCGLSFEAREPGWTNRALLALIGVLPGGLRWIPVMAGEIVGTAVFRLLHAHLGLFASEPAVQARLRDLIREIWLDEVLHVAYLRAHLGAAGLAAVKLLIPQVARAVLRDVPQLRTLGCTAQRILEELRGGIEIPAEIDWLVPDNAPELQFAVA